MEAPPDIVLPQRPGGTRLEGAIEAGLDRLIEAGNPVVSWLDWHHKRWWALVVMFALLLGGAMLSDGGGALAPLGVVAAVLGGAGITLTLVVPLLAMMVWLSAGLIIMLVLYPLYHLLRALRAVLLRPEPAPRELRIWLMPASIDLEGHAVCEDRGLGHTRQRFALLDADGRPQPVELAAAPRSRWSLRLRDEAGRGWSFPKLTLSGEEARSLRQALDTAQQRAAQRHGGGRAEVPEALTELR